MVKINNKIKNDIIKCHKSLFNTINFEVIKDRYFKITDDSGIYFYKINTAKLHNLDGPANILKKHNDIFYEGYYIDGNRYCKEEWEEAKKIYCLRSIL